MTDTTCVCCQRPMPDQAYACTSCAHGLGSALLVAAGHAEDAEAVITRQVRYGAGSRGGSGSGLDPDLRASARLAAITATIGGWARVVTEETGRQPAWRPTEGPLCPPVGRRCEHDSCAAIRRRMPASTLALETAWLSRQTGWLRKHPAAKEAFADLHTACYDLARLVDRPVDRELVGMCDCGRTLYAPHGQVLVQCPGQTCQLTWHVERSREILRQALDGKLVTAAEASWLASFLDTDRTQEQIRKLINAWSSRSLIVARGEIDREPTFRFGDVAGRLARTPRRAPARVSAA